MTTNESLGTALPAEMKRIREVVIPAYREVGPAGGFAIAMMNADLSRAEAAMISGDVIGMIDAYKALKDYAL